MDLQTAKDYVEELLEERERLYQKIRFLEDKVKAPTKESGGYVLTISPTADGGPEHIIHLLRGYYVNFKKEGKVVASGVIGYDYDRSQLIPIEEMCGECGHVRHDIISTLKMYEDFDEVVYL